MKYFTKSFETENLIIKPSTMEEQKEEIKEESSIEETKPSNNNQNNNNNTPVTNSNNVETVVFPPQVPKQPVYSCPGGYIL